jgi:hypothetical protein
MAEAGAQSPQLEACLVIAALAVAGALLIAAPSGDPSPTPAADATPSASAASPPAAGTTTTTPTATSNGSVRKIGSSYTLPAGEVTDNVQVTGGSVRIEGTVTGDVVVIGGSATIDGTVGHDVWVTGGSVHLGPHSSVGHDVRVAGGSIRRAPGSRVGHDVIGNSIGGDFGDRFGFRPFPVVPGLGLAIAIVVIGVLIQAFFPRQLSSTGAAVVDRPLASLGVGCLTAIAGAMLTVLLVITILGSFVVVLAMIGAFLFGSTAIVLAVGQRMMVALDWHGGPIWAIILGGVLAALVLSIPFLGGFVLLVGGACALGAVVLTRFGTRPATPGLPPSPPPPPTP